MILITILLKLNNVPLKLKLMMKYIFGFKCNLLRGNSWQKLLHLFTWWAERGEVIGIREENEKEMGGVCW